MLKRQATLAKLTRPKPVSVVPRERLYRLLDVRLLRPTVWVSGPPGSGKTTLLSGYAESRKRPTLWYQFDSDDADVATFFHYLAVAARELTGRRADALPALTPEYLPDLIGFTRRFFRAFFSCLPRGSLLALDDYHEVPPGSHLHGVFACALAELPQGVGCLVASRTEPPPECARLVANQSIVALEWEALRLTEDEVVAIAHTHQVTDESVIKTTHRRSGGWVAGLILLLGQPNPPDAGVAPVLTPSSKSLYNYFASIFTHLLPAEARDVLESTAFLQAITASVAVRLSENDHAPHILQQLHQANYFVGRRVGAEPTYELHALFREFLVEYVTQRCTREERLEKLRRTAMAVAESGESEQAAILFSEAGDWERAIGLVLSLAPHLLMQGRWQTLQARIAAFPAEEIEARPWLQYWLGASQMAIDPDTARATLTKCHAGFARDHDVIGQMIAGATILEIQFILWSDFTIFDRWTRTLEELLTEGIAFPDADIEIRVLSNLVAALTFSAPWHPKLGIYRGRLLELALSDAAASQRLVAGANLAHHFAWIGDVERSLQACSVGRPLITRKDILPVHKVWATMSFAYAAYARADHDDGDTLFAQAFALSEEHGLSYADFWIRAADCWRKLDRGECKTVAAIVAQLETRVPVGRGMDVAHFHLIKGWLALLEGQLPAARQHLETAHALAAEAGANYTQSYNALLLAEVSIELGKYAQAEDWVAGYRALFSRVDSPVFEFNALLVDAYAALAKGDEARCADALRAAFAIGRTSGYVQTWNWYPLMMSRLCAFALDQRIEVEYARMLIKRRRLIPESPLETWPWPVKIYTLGRVEILTDGEALHFEGKAQRKPLELAKVLVALGGRDIPVDKLIDILWPGPSDGDGQKAFDITVHRLRKLLRSDEAIQVSDRRATLNPRLVWADVWSLERTLAPLIGAVNAAEPDIGLLEAAAPQVLELYRGHFLAGEPEEPWQIPIRNRLAGRFERFALRLGEHWESLQQWRRAIQLYERAVEIHPLAESFYRRQMICLHALGQRAEAIDVFRRCRQVLSVTLSVAPAQDTEAVYRQLLGSQSARPG